MKRLIKISGLNRSNIDFYERTNLLGPALRKYTKARPKRPKVFYSEKDVLKALIITDLQDAGFSLPQIRTAIENLDEMGFGFDTTTHLLTDGESVYVAHTPEEVIDILKRKRQMFLLVSIEDQLQRVAKPKSA